MASITNTVKSKFKKGLSAKQIKSTNKLSKKFPRTKAKMAILFFMFNKAHNTAPEKRPQTGSGTDTKNTKNQNSFDAFLCEIKSIGFCKIFLHFSKNFNKNFGFFRFVIVFSSAFKIKNSKIAASVLATNETAVAPTRLSLFSPQIKDAPSGTAIFVSIAGMQEQTATTKITPNFPKICAKLSIIQKCMNIVFKTWKKPPSGGFFIFQKIF